MKETVPYILIVLAAVYILALAKYDHRKFRETHCITGMLTGFLAGMLLGAAVGNVELISSTGMLAGTIAGTFLHKKHFTHAK